MRMMSRSSVLCINGKLVKVIDIKTLSEESIEDNLLKVKEETPEVLTTVQHENNVEHVLSVKCLNEESESSNCSDINVTDYEIEDSSEKEKQSVQSELLKTYSGLVPVKKVAESLDSSISTLEDCDSKPDITEISLEENKNNIESIAACSSNEPQVIDFDEIPDLIPTPSENSSELVIVNSYSVPFIKKEKDDDSETSRIETASYQNASDCSSRINFTTFPGFKVPSSFVENYSSPTNSPPVQRNVFQGEHHFQVKFREPDASDKSAPCVYIEEKNLLFVAKQQPFSVLVKAESVPFGAVIKACAVFIKNDYFHQTVQRCPTHAQIDYIAGRTKYDHFVQSLSPRAIYFNDCGVRSVAVPYEPPEMYRSYSSFIFKLTCFSSCYGGINRRAFQLLFTLEKDGIALGRCAVETRVCANPGRDCKNILEKMGITNYRFLNDDKGNPLSIESTDNRNRRKFSVTVTDPKLYQFLKEMKELYETSTIALKLKQNVVQQNLKKMKLILL